MEFVIDNTTLLLLGVLAFVAVYLRFFSHPTPLVHPLLLGKQSDVSAVRRKGESGVYRSFATGQGSPFTVRPSSSLQTVLDVTRSVRPTADPAQRSILDTNLSDEALAEVVRLLPLGLQALFLSLTGTTSIITVLPPSSSTALPLLLLQLGAVSPLVVLPSPSFLIQALSSEKHPSPGLVVIHANVLDDVVEQVWEERQTATSVVVVGDPDRTKAGTVKAAGARGLVVHFWEDIWDAAEKSNQVDRPEPKYSDIHSYFYSSSPTGETRVNKVTHMNITAGIAGLLSIFPADKRPSSAQKDVVASHVSLNTPFGMTVALASIWSGAGFRFIGPAESTWPDVDSFTVVDCATELLNLSQGQDGANPPSILFISKSHHYALLSKLYSDFQGRFLAGFAAKYKLAGIQGGDVSRTGWWEKLVWSPLRKTAFGGIVGDRLRAVVIVGDAPTAETLVSSHLLLSLPISRIRSSLYSTGPISASHFYDLQCHIAPALRAPTFNGPQAHVGPPASNVEVVLRGPTIDESYEKHEQVRGRVLIRGPTALEPVGVALQDWWVDTEEDAVVQTNGTFVYDSQDAQL